MVERIKINPFDLSKIFWDKILSNSYLKQKTIERIFFEKIDQLDQLRSQSDYNTGSITSTTSWLLFSVVFFFKPKIIVEVGSFIGKSTISMALASDIYNVNKNTTIYCCDHSNEINLSGISKTPIIQFHKTTSTDMFKSFSDEIKFELIHLDGRLQDEDYEILKTHITENTIFILDDFSGIEKGVINYQGLVKKNIISRKHHLLIKPIDKNTSTQYNLIESSTSAILLPVNYLHFSNE